MKIFSITYTLSSPGSFFQHLHSPGILSQPFQPGMFLARIRLPEFTELPETFYNVAKPLEFFSSAKSPGISYPQYFFFSCRFFPHLDQVAHSPFASTAPWILFKASVTYWKFYVTAAIVLLHQIKLFSIIKSPKLIFHFAPMQDLSD